MNNELDISNIRKLVDSLLALQWCRENIVVPLGTEFNRSTGNEN